MIFPPIKPDRAVLWISLQDDEGAKTRFSRLREVLKGCRLHPLDTTGSAVIVIVGTDAFAAQRAIIEDLLGPGDLLHLITNAYGRLSVEVIAGSEAAEDAIEHRPGVRLPDWIHEG